MNRPFSTASLAALGLGIVAAAEAATVQIASPAMDKWYYGNVPGSFQGSDDTAPTFANSGERLAEMLMGFKTSDNIATGLGASNYLVTSVKLYLTVYTDESFIYDPSYDSYATYLPGGSGNYIPDADAGRPVELFGLGLRNGYTELGASINGALPHQYHENSPHFTNDIPNAFSLGYDANGNPRDVTNNVGEAFDYTPFALGVTQEVEPGELVPMWSVFEFALDLNNPSILAYIQQALNSGMLGFMASSLHESSGQTGGTTYPGFYTRNNQLDAITDPFDERFGPRIEIIYTAVPEPTASVLFLAGVALFATGRAWRHRNVLS